MPQRQWRSDDTDKWIYGFGSGVDGNLTISADTTDAPIDSACSGTSGTTSLTATNVSFASGQLVMIHQTRGTGVGNWELNRISSYTAGTITLTHNLMNTYTNSGSSVAQVVVLKQYQNVTINSGKTLTAKAWNGTVGGVLAFIVNNSTTTSGAITAFGKGFGGGLGVGNTANAYSGEGTLGPSTQSSSSAANGNGAGSSQSGTDNNHSNGGSGGGNGTGGAGGENYSNQSVGDPGTTAGTSNLTTAVFGGGGGGGSKRLGNYATNGGAGGGFILIITNNLVVTGSITNTGVQGGDATDTNDWACGGGGAGGSILIKTQTATLGTNLATASGGRGGLKITSRNNGGNGGTGRIHIDYSSSYTGTTTPTLDAVKDTSIVPPSSGSFIFNLL